MSETAQSLHEMVVVTGIGIGEGQGQCSAISRRLNAHLCFVLADGKGLIMQRENGETHEFRHFGAGFF
jgi:hypothetical protein